MMSGYPYAHNDTSRGEKRSGTAQFVKLNINEKLQAVREGAFARRIPVADDETLNFLTCLVSAAKPKNILELGTAVGVSGIQMLLACPEARLTTVEKSGAFCAEAAENLKAFGLNERATLIEGDAAQAINVLEGSYDFIFLDSAKVQYIKYLPRLKALLAEGGVLVADDVLLYGWVNGEEEAPKKRKMLVEHIREYIEAATADPELYTCVLNVGDGVCVSVKKSK